MPSITGLAPIAAAHFGPDLAVTGGNTTHAAAALVPNHDIFEAPAVSSPHQPVATANDAGQEADLGWAYRLKQYSTDALIAGGAGTAFVLLLIPEPFITKLLAGIVALACVVGGLVAKHHFLKQASLNGALEKTVGQLGGHVDRLDVDIQSLENTRRGLESTNVSLESNRVKIETEVTRLKTQVTHLRTDVNEAFAELNTDRAHFEKEKQDKLQQLNDEIAEADARGGRAQKKLDILRERETQLNALSSELETRRVALVESEAKLEKIQAALLRQMTGR